MKFSEYIESLQRVLKENPESSDYEVITSIDDEGNGYNQVHYTPSIGFFGENRDWVSRDNYKEEPEEYSEYRENSICVN